MMNGLGLMHFPIGILFSSSGITSVVERTQLDAVLLAISEINESGGVRGTPVLGIQADPRSDPREYGRLAEQMVNDGVRHFVGCYMSSARQSVVPVVERSNSLLCYPTFYEGFEYCPNLLYFGGVPNQTHIKLTEYICRNFGRRIWLIGSDYIFPRESNRVFRSIIAKEGGFVVGETYVPLGSPANVFDLAMKEVRLARPSAIISTVVGEDTKNLYEAYDQTGLKPTETPIASITTTEAELKLLSPGVAAGHISCGTYFSGVSAAGSGDFVSALRKFSSGRSPANMCAEAAYVATHVLARALNSSERLDARSVVSAANRVEFLAPQGGVHLDARNNHCYLWCRIARTTPNNDFELLYESDGPSAPDPYMIEAGTSHESALADR